MDDDPREAPSGHERVRTMFEDRGTGIGTGDDEAMRLAVSGQHAGRSPEATVSHAVGGLPFAVRFSDGGDGWVMAQVQEVPGAVSQGRTREEARANVVDALLLILCSDSAIGGDAGRESRDLPEPVAQPFDTRVVIGEDETAVSLPAFGLVGTGGTFDAAIDDLVEVLREYCTQYLRRIDFAREAGRGSMPQDLVLFALTPADQQRDLLLCPPMATSRGGRDWAATR